MVACPVCQENVHADEAAFNHHVNSHFEGGGGGGESSRRPHPPSPPSKRSQPSVDHTGSRLETEDTRSMETECFICGYPLAGLQANEKQTHVNGCLDEQNGGGDSKRDGGNDLKRQSSERDFEFSEQAMQATGQADDNDWVEVDWDGPAKPGGWSDWVNKKVDRGDKWWDPVDGRNVTDIPSNFSPEVIPVLQHLLTSSVSRDMTRHAILSRHVTAIKGVWGFDMGWGCGHRNALMAISALLMIAPEWRKAFSRDSNGADPGVRRVQGWIEEAWAEGFDSEGSEQLRGKALGTKKWIGTTDLYAMFTSKGVPCELYDFPKPSSRPDGHFTASGVLLQDWVKKYFNIGQPPTPVHSSFTTEESAFDVLMRPDENGSGRGEAVRMSDKMPLILQQSGHSRTIVGYEENGNGDINLLVLDPGSSVPKEVRNAGISLLSSNTDIPSSLTPPRNTFHKASHESIPFSRPYSNGASETSQLSIHDSNDDNNGFDLLDDEEMNEAGWVKKKVRKVLQKKESRVGQGRQGNVVDSSRPVARHLSSALKDESLPKTLGYFRVNLSSLGSYTQYQVLAFTGGPMLSSEERRRRKVVKSTAIRQ